MSNRINWDDGSFEFIDEESLKKLNTKKYAGTNCPLLTCRFCAEKKCTIYQAKAEEVSQLIFAKYFDENIDEDVVISTLDEHLNEIGIDFGFADRNLLACVILHLLQKIDEETMIEVTDALIQKTLKVILK